MIDSDVQGQNYSDSFHCLIIIVMCCIYSLQLNLLFTATFQTYISLLFSWTTNFDLKLVRFFKSTVHNPTCWSICVAVIMFYYIILQPTTFTTENNNTDALAIAKSKLISTIFLIFMQFWKWIYLYMYIYFRSYIHIIHETDHIMLLSYVSNV